MATQESPLTVIEEEARAVAQFFGIKACDLAAKMLVGRVASRLGGERGYFAGYTLRKDKKHAEVCKLFTGHNYAEVSEATGYSVRQIRRIVGKSLREDVS